MTKIEDVKIGKLLGKGYKGNVYLATDKKGNEYALKKEQVLKTDVPKTYKSFIWRQLDFAKTLANRYPDQFMKIYDYEICDDDSYHHNHTNLGNVNLNATDKKMYDKLFASPYSLITLTSKVDGIFGHLKLSPSVFYDLFIQNVYIAYLINAAGYMHCDMHENNIGFVRTSEKTIKILNHSIPTHGYLLQVIDYGNVLSNKYILTAAEKTRFESDNDLSPPINNFLIKFDTLRKTYKELKDIDFDDVLYKMKVDKDFDECRKLLPDKKFYKQKILENFLMRSLYKLKFYEKFEKHLLGDKLIKTALPDLLLPKNAIIYMICHFGDIPAVLEYLIKNR